MSAILELRQRYKEAFKSKYGVGLGFMSVFCQGNRRRACGPSPIVNARIDGADVVYSEDYHIGVAVSTERGLMVPVVRSAQNLSFAAIEKPWPTWPSKPATARSASTICKAERSPSPMVACLVRSCRLPFSIRRKAPFWACTPFRNGAVVVDDQIVIRPMMYLAVSYDHRLIDGREAVQFLVRIKDCLERPERLLLEV